MDSSLRKPIGILVIAWFLIIIGGLGILSAILEMAAHQLPLGLGLVQLFIGVITLALGLALRALKRWILIALLAYFGVGTVAGVLGILGGRAEGWLATLIFGLLLLYMWRVQDAFAQKEDDASNLSLVGYPPPSSIMTPPVSAETSSGVGSGVAQPRYSEAGLPSSTSRHAAAESDRKKKRLFVALLAACLVVVALTLSISHFDSKERVVAHLFLALQHQNYEQAYGIWVHDNDWKQHPQRYSWYPFEQFIRDVGPNSEWGVVKTYRIESIGVPRGASGNSNVARESVVAIVTINEDSENKVHIMINKSNNTMSWSPY